MVGGEVISLMVSPAAWLTAHLSHNQYVLSAYAFTVAFVTYSCMYAFRKPFTVGEFHHLRLGKIHFKILLITAQMIGYTISKFPGIVVISGLKRGRRGLQIVL
jgi:hypothetical protein